MLISSDRGARTRIDYTSTGLCLLYKSSMSASWTTFDSELPCDQSALVTPIHTMTDNDILRPCRSSIPPDDDIAEASTSAHPEIEQLIGDQFNISQVDGTIDIMDDSYQASNHDSITSVRLKDYSFNHDKQLKKIEEDAKLVDYHVSVNSNNENCNIECSSGFYVQIARPCISALDENTLLNSANITITVTEVVINKDKNHYEANRKILFKFANKNEDIGGVTVHIHDSARLVQIQGGSIMPDRNKAAIWFAKIVLEKFLVQAKHNKLWLSKATLNLSALN